MLSPDLFVYFSLKPGDTATSTVSKVCELPQLADGLLLPALLALEDEFEVGPLSSKWPKLLRGSRHGGRHQVRVPEHLSNFRKTAAT